VTAISVLKSEKERLESEYEGHKAESKQEIYDLRADLKEQVLFIKAVESEKKSLQTKSAFLEEQLKEVKRECAETLAHKESTFLE
jgi:hypothetical protein